MSSNKHHADMEMSHALERADALNLLILYQIRGYLPYMSEQGDGTYIVHRGESTPLD